MDSYHIHLEGIAVYLVVLGFFNRSGSPLQFTAMAKGYEQVAMTKMMFLLNTSSQQNNPAAKFQY